MIIRQLAILILVGAASSASAQQACKPIRLDVGAGPLARTTMIDQSALGLCQFATTAYLVEAETARLNGAAASPISYIQLFTEYIDRYGLDGPYEPKNIASAARQAGGCPPAAVSALVTADASLCVDEKRVAASLMGDQGRVIGPTCPARDNATPDDDQQFAYSRAVLKVVVGANSAAAPDLVKRVRTACDGARTDLSRLPEIERLSAYQLAEAERGLFAR